jgi:hypothetical protein
VKHLHLAAIALIALSIAAHVASWSVPAFNPVSVALAILSLGCIAAAFAVGS